MKKLEKDQAIIISAYTGYLICNFSDMHEEVERRMGRPVFTHEFGLDDFFDDLRKLFKEDFLSMYPESCNN